MLAGFRSGTLIKSRIKYIVGGGYGNINLSFYKTFDQSGEKKLNFNIKALPVFLQATKRIGLSHWYPGIKYLFLNTDVKYNGDKLLDSLAKTFESNSIVSQLGGIVELDNRDNIFTPDKGLKIHFDVLRSDDFIGSDYDYWRLNYYMFAYKPLSKKLIAGFRFDGQQAFGEPPFYMLPYISMRGSRLCDTRAKQTFFPNLKCAGTL
jgi:outer membrane protein assembly factor BamA